MDNVYLFIKPGKIVVLIIDSFDNGYIFLFDSIWSLESASKAHLELWRRKICPSQFVQSDSCSQNGIRRLLLKTARVLRGDRASSSLYLGPLLTLGSKTSTTGLVQKQSPQPKLHCTRSVSLTNTDMNFLSAPFWDTRSSKEEWKGPPSLNSSIFSCSKASGLSQIAMSDFADWIYDPGWQWVICVLGGNHSQSPTINNFTQWIKVGPPNLYLYIKCNQLDTSHPKVLW